MKIVIVENEFYLAQSIQNKIIEEFQAKCDIYASYNEAFGVDADVFIVNSNLSGNLESFIDEKKDKIIILLVPYVTFNTVTNPINLGADDYLQKPFIIEELVRKIIHLQEFYNLKHKSRRLEKFISHVFDDVEVELKEVSFPLFIKSNNKRLVDKFVFEYAKKYNLEIEVTKFKKLPKVGDENILYYLVDFDEDYLNRALECKSIILVDSSFKNVYPGFNMLVLNSDKDYMFGGDILSIEEYVKHMIISYQDKLTDTELSRQLGMSRKSLWEKRKKYGIFKQK